MSCTLRKVNKTNHSERMRRSLFSMSTVPEFLAVIVVGHLIFLSPYCPSGQDFFLSARSSCSAAIFLARKTYLKE